MTTPPPPPASPKKKLGCLAKGAIILGIGLVILIVGGFIAAPYLEKTGNALMQKGKQTLILQIKDAADKGDTAKLEELRKSFGSTSDEDFNRAFREADAKIAEKNGHPTVEPQ